MGDSSTQTPSQPYGTLRFAVPDLSVSAYERGLFAFPASKSVAEYHLPLHDARTSPNLLQGAAGLDTHGFTYIKHKSALSESGDPATDWYTGTNVEDVYLPEVVKLVCEITGAKTAVVNNVAFRRRLADKQVDLTYYIERDGELDKELGKIPKDIPLIYGKEAGLSLEPARVAHIDYTLQGLKDTVRYCRHDIAAAAKPALDAEDASSAQNPTITTTTPTHSVPRYAAFSVWRPIQPVKRDPLAVCDIQTIASDELIATPYRAISDINSSGEYTMESVAVLPPKNPSHQRWYWMPEQKADEVLIVKFADTATDINISSTGERVMGGICGAGGAPHLSPIIDGTEDEEPRISIEARVLAFW